MAGDIDRSLQLAMAFGQGAGAMRAEDGALQTLLDETALVIKAAETNWASNPSPLIDVVRALGQLSAAKAAANGKARIRWVDIKPCIRPAMDICPSLGPALLEKLLGHLRL